MGGAGENPGTEQFRWQLVSGGRLLASSRRYCVLADLLRAEDGVTGQLLKVKSGLKSLSFAGGKATIEGRFALTSIPMADDPGGPLISGIGRWDFEGSYHVSPSGLVADTNDIDVFEIKMFLNETPIGAVPRPAGVSGFVPGQTVPFRCVGDRLTIEEPGASGPVSVEYRRVA